MTKLDDAVRAAAEAYFNEPCDELDDEVADNFRAAIQAAVKVLVPEEKNPYRTSSEYEKGYLCGHNVCRAEILKNAEITDV